MNILLICVLLLQTSTLILCYRQYSDGNESQGAESRGSVYVKYKCIPGSALKKVEGFFLFNATQSCIGVTRYLQDTSYNITFKDNSVSLLSNYDLNSIFSKLKDKHFFKQYGKIYDRVCAPGRIYVENTNIITDGHCSSWGGVRKTESIQASLMIKGGPCDSKCFGKVSISFDPGLRDQYSQNNNYKFNSWGY